MDIKNKYKVTALLGELESLKRRERALRAEPTPRERYGQLWLDIRVELTQGDFDAIREILYQRTLDKIKVVEQAIEKL